MEAPGGCAGPDGAPPDSREERRKRKKSRWGAETEAGIKVLEAVQQPGGGGSGRGGGAGGAARAAAAAPARAATPDAPAPGAAEAAPKRRRSRWEPQASEHAALPASAGTAAAAPGQIVLPDAIARLITLHSDPRVLELQAQLKAVSGAQQGRWVAARRARQGPAGAAARARAPPVRARAQCAVRPRRPRRAPRPNPLHQVDQKLALLAAGSWFDPRPEYERSPSPEPVYDSQGARANTRDARQKEVLGRQRTVRRGCGDAAAAAAARGWGHGARECAGGCSTACGR
jgi:hypothetical protein